MILEELEILDANLGGRPRRLAGFIGEDVDKGGN